MELVRSIEFEFLKNELRNFAGDLDWTVGVSQKKIDDTKVFGLSN